MPAGYPVMPLTIRVRTAITNHSSDILDSIEQCQIFFKRAGIQLFLHNNSVEIDGRIPTAFEGNHTIDTLVAYTWINGQYWFDVVFSGQINTPGNGATLKGYASTPGSQTQNIGVLVAVKINTPWSILAHELGHALGLPHAFNEDESASLLPNGQRFIDAAMAPFIDETEALSNRARNFMFSFTPTFAPMDIGLTRTQIERMRLTLVSRKNNLAQASDERDSFNAGVSALSFRPQPDTSSQVFRSCFG